MNNQTTRDTSSSPLHYRPGHSRRGEDEELLAATLASGIISATNQNVSPEAAVTRFREVLAVLRKENPHG